MHRAFEGGCVGIEKASTLGEDATAGKGEGEGKQRYAERCSEAWNCRRTPRRETQRGSSEALKGERRGNERSALRETKRGEVGRRDTDGAEGEKGKGKDERRKTKDERRKTREGRNVEKIGSLGPWDISRCRDAGMRVHLVLRLSHREEMLSVSHKHAEYTSVKRAEAEAENDLLRRPLSVVDVTTVSPNGISSFYRYCEITNWKLEKKYGRNVVLQQVLGFVLWIESAGLTKSASRLSGSVGPAGHTESAAGKERNGEDKIGHYQRTTSPLHSKTVLLLYATMRRDNRDMVCKAGVIKHNVIVRCTQ
ncbi:hypothetical protein K0M31_007361 [Melipona bicolor]|uniref:Uncharacterized protein n=1 Tax=Melipona bicolor TaxID=60889 RepID=A0AA40KVQ8_9HYME|nr:hypothetical protein K0M31_007361 [Melipona bicolor]